MQIFVVFFLKEKGILTFPTEKQHFSIIFTKSLVIMFQYYLSSISLSHSFFPLFVNKLKNY